MTIRMPDIAGRFCKSNEQVGRNTAPIETRPTEFILLDQSHFLTSLYSRNCQCRSSSSTKDDEIKLLTHQGLEGAGRFCGTWRSWAK